MQAIGIIVGVVIAVSGWIVTQYQARRAVRRNMRINYLLDAYRCVDRAGNRVMTADDRRDLENAYSDIILLGSAAQVQLAEKFGRDFADTGEADSSLLLEDLRSSLRRELLLEEVPPRGVWLRIGAHPSKGSPQVRREGVKGGGSKSGSN